MEPHKKLPVIALFLILFIPLAFAGCVTELSQIPRNTKKTQETAVVEEPKSAPPPAISREGAVPPPPRIEEDEVIAALPKAEPEETRGPLSASAPLEFSHPSAPPELPKKSDQQLLDSALEFCQASNDYWEHGDMDNAMAALDQAYSLILEIDPDHNPEILQQRDDLRFTISKRIIECYASRFSVTNGNHKAIPLVMNAHVESALRLFKGKDKRFFLEAYKRSGRYRPAIVQSLREAGLPDELSWLPLIESGFKLRALSRARALGLWQFIASTGYKFGLKRDRWIDERMDPKKSTRAAIAYLKELHQIFGDWTTALAAYNCGEWAVLRSIRTQKINYLDNFWDLYIKLPTETAFYVPKFLAVLHILNDPEGHGFSLPTVYPEINSETVSIHKPVHLKTVAKHLAVSYKDLRDLNPELRYNYTPDRPYTLKVPMGKKETLLAEIDAIPVWRPPVPTYVIHRVRRGENLSVIARRYGTSVRAITRLNRLRSRRYIKAGWKLKIPTSARYASAQRASSQPSTAKTKGEHFKYVVRKGDSLWRLAGRFGTTIQRIQSLNRLRNTHLQKGQVLKIPKMAKASKDMETRTYRVSKGDSPFSIAQKYQMNLSQFLRLNRLTPRSTIFPGQTLLVRAE